MKNKKTVATAISAFCLTACILLTIGGLLLTDMRSGRVLFGDAYEHVSVQQEKPLHAQSGLSFVWLPARLQVLFRLPLWETRGIQWLLSRM